MQTVQSVRDSYPLALPGSLTKEIDTECANTYPGCARTVALPVMGPRLCERGKNTVCSVEPSWLWLC